jgi:hypothetical protein
MQGDGVPNSSNSFAKAITGENIKRHLEQLYNISQYHNGSRTGALSPDRHFPPSLPS